MPLPNVPLLGQPVTVLSYTLTPVLQCNCAERGVVTMMASLDCRAGLAQRTKGICTSCGAAYQIGGATVNPQTGALDFQIEVLTRASKLVAS